MNLTNLTNILFNTAKVKFGIKRLPLFVSWSITHKCNLQCGYCGRWDLKNNEMGTKVVLDTIDQLSKIGTKVISFGGGEPLLRDDIGEIIKYCISKGIQVGLISNGLLVSKKIEELKDIKVIKISFDGPEAVNDMIRGKGSYKSALEAVDFAKKHGIKVVFNTTISKYNLDSVDFIVEKAKELNIQVKFQPINYIVAQDKPIEPFLPDKAAYQKTINKIIKLKRKNKNIINSFESLNYLYHWPDKTYIKCYAGKIICHISPTGDMYPCTMLEGKVNALNCKTDGVGNAFYKMKEACCNECWCTSTLELNSLMSLKYKPIKNIMGFGKDLLK